MDSLQVDITYLKNHIEQVPLLASWMFKTWGHYNPTSSLEKAEQKLLQHLNIDTLPLAYIALHNEVPVGMCSLRVNDGIQHALTPWLGSLYVEPLMRGRGIGEQLINTAAEKALNLGYSKLYLFAFDKTLPQWYEKLGWLERGVDEINRYPVTVMELSL
ncbi:GNAT family N-acetyltransferase [Candidatus Berkiella aquae]|uniref:Acetyltransferase (GNAT) family protein n=1 Tax=Candidatus Berkiella aquae TaxID=295108 RepID=A0A0Q9YPP6_9GAMM|nr:GNAT family N-acetyltransferase [Candidatus Berkiella aquae]MCS5711874.1 GNAT family N-acetyltransferase [Candidatus Berkiella aquae]